MQMHWDSNIGREDSIEKLRALALLHLGDETQDHQCATLRALIERREWRAVVEFEPRYADGGNVTSYIALRQALAFFSKNRSLDIGIDTQAVAYQKFAEAETLCNATNQIFSAWERGDFQFHPDVEAVFHGAQRKISQILGEVPDWSAFRFRYGPGATASIPKRLAHARLKLSEGVVCSEDLLPVVPRLLRELPAYLESLKGERYTAHGWEWQSVRCQIMEGRLDFVAKNAKTDRAIVVEPSLNTLFQAGVGGYIADRLREHGQDIRDQARNARLAREGSLTGALATLDLSSASDTVSTGIVSHLLPYDWYELLSFGRTSVVRYGDKSIALEKFSSMGNGFTFPLETLLFYALAVACCDHLRIKGPISVYGDDIVIPSEAVPVFLRVLRAAGFLPNPQKSFWDGPFRESCGKDYYRGIDIRPVYVKDVLSPAALFVMHNFYVRQLDPRSAVILNWIPQHLRLWGPPEYGDGHLHGKWDGRRNERHRQDGFGGWLFETWSFSSPKTHRALPGDFLFPVYSVYLKDSDDQDIDPFTTYRELVDRRSIFSRAERAPLSHQRRDKRRGWVWNTSLPGRGRVRKLSIYTLTQPDLL